MMKTPKQNIIKKLLCLYFLILQLTPETQKTENDSAMTFASSKMHTLCWAIYLSIYVFSSDLKLICFLSR